MTYGFYIFICMIFVIIRTTMVSICPLLNNCFDFFLPVIVYLGFFRSARESAFAIAVFGLTMDSLSGVPFGLHTSTYIWLYVPVYILKQYLQVKNVVMLALMTATGVTIENGLLVIAENLFNPQLDVVTTVFKAGLIQLGSAIFGGPVIIFLIKSLHEAWNAGSRNIVSRIKAE